MDQTVSTEAAQAKRANEYLTGHRSFREPERLFDAFWREGELALFFGAAGTGKSVLAVQLADALSRGGGGIDGFRGPSGRRRVLYVDLRHTDEQFLMRSANLGLHAKFARPHRFPRNMLRGRPRPGADLCEWLRAAVRANGIQAVIVDDLSAAKNTHDGTRETLALMRGLRRLRDELRISILVLAGSDAPARGRPVSETDLGRSRVLCSVADSVFAAGRGRKKDDDYFLVQTRSAADRPAWTWKNAPRAEVRRNATGLLTFMFDARFGARIPEETRHLICEVVRLQEQESKTFREIAKLLGISKSWACELYRRWTPMMERGIRNDECGMEHEDEDDWEDDDSNAEFGMMNDEFEEGRPGSGSPPYKGGVDSRVFQREDGVVLSQMGNEEFGIRNQENEIPNSAFRTPHSNSTTPSAQSGGHPSSDKEGSWVHPSNAEFGIRNYELQEDGPEPETFRVPHSEFRISSIYDLEPDVDAYGNEIYIETRCEHTGKPTLWYRLDKQNLKRRYTRSPSGIHVETLDSGPLL